MTNEVATSDMEALLDQVIQGTDIGVSVSKSVRKFDMDEQDAERAGDTMWLPQEFRFEVLDGITSTDSDFEDLVDRMVPINLNKAKRILAEITVKEQRDPRLLKMAAQGMSRDLKNAIDMEVTKTLMNSATMVVRQTGNFSFSDGLSAELLMDDSGLTGYDRNLILSTPHYSRVAETLGTTIRTSTNLTAFEKAQIPPLGGFNTMKADYRLNLAANATTNITVNGDQSHTIATKGSDDFYQDNRGMTIALTNATSTNLPVGSKLTIAGVNRVHPDTKESTGELMTFSVKTSATGTAFIEPAIVISGPYQNCSAQAATGSAVVLLNTHVSAPSIFYTPESVVLVPGNLPTGNEANNGSVVSMVTEQGIPVQLSYERDFHTGNLKVKMLAFFDVQVVNPEQVGVILANQS